MFDDKTNFVHHHSTSLESVNIIQQSAEMCLTLKLSECQLWRQNLVILTSESVDEILWCDLSKPRQQYFHMVLQCIYFQFFFTK